MEIGIILKILAGIALAIAGLYYRQKKSKDKKSLSDTLTNEFPRFDSNTIIFNYEGNELFAASEDEIILLTEDMDGNRHNDIFSLNDLTNVEVIVNDLTASNLLNDFDESAIKQLWNEGTAGYGEARSLLIKFKIKNGPRLGLPSLELIGQSKVKGESGKLSNILPEIRKIQKIVQNDS